MRNLNKKQNLVEQARIKLDKEKIAHSITLVRVEELKSIIKEAREYIDNDFNRFDCFGSMAVAMEMNHKREELLEILDKVEKENDIEFDVLKALNTDLDDDVEMG